jgi:hypothetical protein
VVLVEIVAGIVIAAIGYAVVSALCPDECSVDYDAVWDEYECNCPDGSK